MRNILALTAAALLASGAGAQVLGGNVGGVGSTIGGGVDAGRTLPDATTTVERTTDTATRGAERSARPGKSVKVEAGASARVVQGTRCYYDDHDHDPIYRDGHYYCERTGSGVIAGARVGD